MDQRRIELPLAQLAEQHSLDALGYLQLEGRMAGQEGFAQIGDQQRPVPVYRLPGTP
jgi:hypothetical protein